jgi:hypothetical protein
MPSIISLLNNTSNNTTGGLEVNNLTVSNSVTVDVINSNNINSSNINSNNINTNFITSNNLKIKSYVTDFTEITTDSYTLEKINPNITISKNVYSISLPTDCENGIAFIINNMGDNDIDIDSVSVKMYNMLLAPEGLTKIPLQKNFMYTLLYTKNSDSLARWNLSF